MSRFFDYLFDGITMLTLILVSLKDELVTTCIMLAALVVVRPIYRIERVIRGEERR